MDWLDELPQELREFVARLAVLPDFPRRLAEFGLALRERHDKSRRDYATIARHAWLLAPNDPQVRQLSDWGIRRRIPRYHFPIIHDASRVFAYDRAIRQSVSATTTVLEIGTGTGITAMMAARAGAQHVYTCESEPLVADAARQIIAANGYEDRITVIAKRSFDIALGQDLPERAGLLISDLVADDLFGMDVISVMEDARARLLTPNADVIPEDASLAGVLLAGTPWSGLYRIDEVCGFDLSAFNRFAPPTVMYPDPPPSLDGALSDDIEIVRVDFKQSQPEDDRKTVEVNVTRDGVAEGFLHWLRLGMTSSIQLESKPGIRTILRTPIMHVFVEPIAVRVGDIVRLTIARESNSIRIWPAGSQ